MKAPVLTKRDVMEEKWGKFGAVDKQVHLKSAGLPTSYNYHSWGQLPDDIQRRLIKVHC